MTTYRISEDPRPGPCDDACACNRDAAPPAGAAGCTLDADDLPGRLSEWRSLVARAVGRERIDGGVRLSFPAEAGLAATVASLAQAEQDCCSFFEFAVGIGAGGITLDVRAPVDVDALIDSLVPLGREDI